MTLWRICLYNIYGIIQSATEPRIAYTLLLIFIQLVVGIVCGYFGGRVAVVIINRIRMDNVSLYPILLLILGSLYLLQLISCKAMDI